MWSLLALLVMVLIARVWVAYVDSGSTEVTTRSVVGQESGPRLLHRTLNYVGKIGMKLTFLVIGSAAACCGIALVLMTALGRFSGLTGYSAGLALAFGGTLHLFAWRKNYQGHWSFVTGVALLTLGLAAVGGEADSYRLQQSSKSDLVFGMVLAVTFLVFGGLTLWSSYKLHLRTGEVDMHKLPTGRVERTGGSR